MDKLLIGKKLKQIRISRGISQEQLSEMIFLSPRQMSIIETGNSYPSLDTFIRIAEKLEFDINDFFNINIKQGDEKREAVINQLKTIDAKYLDLISDILTSVEKYSTKRNS